MEALHVIPTLFQRPDRVLDPLYVIIPVSNAARFRTRWKLLEDAAKRCEEAHAIPYIVEVAFRDRAFAVTSAENPRHIQLRSNDEIWFKENAVNVGVTRLPSDWKYVAYIDADSSPARDDWANETVQQLQHYAAVQMWSQYHCLNPEYELISSNFSLMYGYMKGWKFGHNQKERDYPTPTPKPTPAWPGSPGLAWAWRRDAWNEVGGLLDVCVMGSADTYMANGLLNRLDDSIFSTKFSDGYRRAVYQWQERAQALRKNIGMVPGLWLHHYHGPMIARQYGTRNNVLKRTHYDPNIHLKRDWQGLYALQPTAPHATELRDGIRKFFHARNEDQL